MKAFLSYSLIDREQYIISLLSNNLRSQGYELSTSMNLRGHTLDFTTTQQIASSQLFIGIISYDGQQRSRVLEEWKYASNNRVPAVLLIEENVQIAQNADPNSYIKFNRHKPQLAVQKIKERMDSSKREEETTGWVLAGAALLAIIALFSSGKK